MKIIIAGGRDYLPNEEEKETVKNILKENQVTGIVSGCATGVDTWAIDLGSELELSIDLFPADWKQHGRSAGPIRNGLMAQYADMLIAFPGGRGTDNMIKQATEKGLKVVFISRTM